MRIGIVSLFPEMFAALEAGVMGRAQRNQLLTISIWNPRDYATDSHKTVDDRPFGGGPGMVMKVEPLRAAIRAAKQSLGDNTPVWLLSPRGQPLQQPAVQHMATLPRVILVAGRYEGIDQRLIDDDIDAEWSIGDYVVSGGELPAMVMIDAIARLLPGVLGDSQSAQQDSFSAGLLDYPHYTRPEEIDGKRVPPVLTGGDHGAIQRWRQQQALGRTWQRRPDLLDKRQLTTAEHTMLSEFKGE